MTLAVRIIPVLLRRGDSLVKGKQFDAWRSVGHPLQAARIHARRQVDEMLYLDIGATPEGRGPDFKMVEKLTRDFMTPVTVGGGVRSVDDVRDLLNAGADKVAIGSMYGVIPKAADKFGSQAIVRIANYQNYQGMDTHSMGEGEILLQSIDRDGMMSGYDLPMLRKISSAATIPVIASCGCGSYQDMLGAIYAGASAVAAGAFFQFTDNTPRGAAQYLHENGVPVRL